MSGLSAPVSTTSVEAGAPAPASDPAWIRERVEAGAARLDATDPDWWRTDPPDGRVIDLAQLDIASGYRCVLGQRYGHFDEIALGIDEAGHCGFDFFHSGEIPQLTAAWVELISERRQAEAARVAAACCPCRGAVCAPGCECPDCPHDVTELVDDDD